ncbi:hypothetical protein I302_108922 [Kwoniella bestiolae CBS 10118]|uniref:F-box domain-containing protein n=1 Tax=Kwoniella bestiolae CBS 10118 TaxID=1296100 RepID=A0A1B9FUH1_9TREE|nr:hypothetical protein I302_08063 [Kwoniella bestiolae CBS 10118]OCF22415.1 hypothetical protein I302_08063 [Kwoniella bestiolae CBS 10118]
MSMLDRLRMRRASFTPSSSTPSSPSASTTSSAAASAASYFPASGRVPVAYELPDKNGVNWLFALPDELLERVFVGLDRITLSRCFRVCKRLNDLCSSSIPISLSYTLQCNSLRLNPNALLPQPSNTNHIPPSRAVLLSSLRERMTRFRNFQPRSTSNSVKFQESEGRLYEYLEGVLLRNVPPERFGGLREIGREVAVYELSKGDDWEDVKDSNSTSLLEGTKTGAEGTREGRESEEEEEVEEYGEDQLVNDIRKTHRFDFDMQDFAVDPGQDLFVVAEVRHPSPRNYTLHIHLLTLSTFQPHPRAAQSTLDWPAPLHSRIASLGFQICDDGLYVLRNNNSGAKDHLVGWQWTTGRLAVTLKPPVVSTFESFILLTPNSFLIPSVRTRLRPDSMNPEDLADARDLIFTHHLYIYAFPPFSFTSNCTTTGGSTATGNSTEPPPPAHTPTPIAIIDLPEFVVDLDDNLPPPRLTIRTDPPPRHTFPTHPEEKIQQFVPEPESGIIIMEFYCQPRTAFPHSHPHYVMFSLKKTFLAYLPAPTSPLLLQAFPRPAPVIKWESIAPKVRLIGPDEPEPSWVCYVYGSRYVVPYPHSSESSTTVRLYDFDPLRVRQELYSRRNEGFVGTLPTSPRGLVQRLMFGLSTSTPSTPATTGKEPSTKRNSIEGYQKYDGDRDGIVLVSEETVLKKKIPLKGEIRTGRELPFIYSEKKYVREIETVVMDGERLVLFDYTDDNEFMEILDF